MPRIARIIATGYPHHITQRGNYRQTVFTEDDDYLQYLEWMDEYSSEYQLSIVAYCLMPNHVHFIAIPKTKDAFARTYNTCHMRYAQYFNKKNNVTGHLWQGRFYSCVLGEKHLYSAVRYVENNPVRKKIVKKAEDWEWSSARDHLRKGESALRLGDINEYLDISDWGNYLKEKQDELIVKDIRGNTITGWPCGDNVFVTTLEKIFGKRLRPLSIGRPINK